MATSLTVLLSVLAGGIVDLGVYWLMVRSRSFRWSALLRVPCRLLMLATIWIMVPVGEYYACSSRGTASHGPLAAFLFFIAGFLLAGVFAMRNKHLGDLRKLEGKTHPAADPVDGNQ